ncbi:DUF6891 domain-containing protein [Streptomyces sp. NPDC127051]|uniref:DUF6891 domain-containing protein n=1 Tax=Streptomyces sp. NPDC127051 TaxID=3347119 RepID=UPI003666D370
MLEVVVKTENGERHVRVSAEGLAGLVRRIGGEGDRFLVVHRIPDLPDVFAQVWHEAGGGYTLEHRDGAADRHFQVRVAEQAEWQGETDPERLTRAFTALQEAGITARENFTCCRSCGQSEIGGEGGTDARGFVYFHSQCTDSAAAGHGLMLLYGGFDGSSETTAAIGHEVVAALEAVGLQADWDRDPGRAITVTSLEWRRRLVG